MREKVNLLARGIISYELPRLIFSQEKLSLKVESGKKLRGRFQISNSLGRSMKGIVCSDNRVLEVLSKQIVGTEATVDYVVHAEYLEEKEVCNGEITLETDCGEAWLPYHIEVTAPTLASSDGVIRNLSQFALLAKNRWDEALRLFFEVDFEAFVNYYEPQNTVMYRFLRKSSSRDRAMEEFLVATGKKMPCVLQAGPVSLEYEVTEADFSDQITITKSNWGYVNATIHNNTEYLSLAYDTITPERFHGNTCSLKFYISPEKMGFGHNEGTLCIEAQNQKLVIPVRCHKSNPNPQELVLRRELNKIYARLLENYLSYSMNRIPAGRYISEAESLLLKSNQYTPEEDLLKRLYQVHLNRLAGKESPANSMLRAITEDEWKKGGVLCQAVYLYLKAERSQSNKGEMMEQLYQLCNENHNVDIPALLLLKLDNRYQKNRKLKFDELRGMYDNGSNSPILFLEAAKILNEDPTLLHEPGAFEIQTVSFAVKRNYISKEVTLQFSYLIEKAREYRPIYYVILKELYDRYQCRETLSAICQILIKAGFKDTRFGIWYQKGVEEQLRIAELYEYYMYSMNQDVDTQLDQTILMYFAYSSKLSDKKLAYLYANVVKHKESNRSVYENYRERIHEYAMEQIRLAKNSTNLAILYADCLADAESQTETLAYLPRVAFTHEICCQNEAMRYVCVAHRELEGEVIVPFINGVAQVEIYTDNYVLALVDDFQNRYVSGIEYTDTRLFSADDRYQESYQRSPESNMLLLYLACKAQKDDKFDQTAIELRKQAVKLSGISADLRNGFIRTLVLYYYDNFQDDMLEEYLSELSLKNLPRKQRGKVIGLMILRGQYENAIQLLTSYGYEDVDVRMLERLSASVSPELQETYSEALLGIMYYCFAKGRRNERIISYLVEHFQGPTFATYQLWQEANALSLSTDDLEERLLAQMLFTESYMDYADRVFGHYQKPGSNRQLVRAYLTFVSYKYLICDVMIGTNTITYMKKDVYADENDICILALLRMFSEKEELAEDEKSAAEYWLLRMEAKGKILPCFLKLGRYFKLPEGLEDKCLIEYRTNPKHRVTLHYTYRQNGKRRQKDLPMRNICYGIFVKELVLFVGETIEYVISDEDGDDTLMSEKVTLSQTMENIDSRTRFGQINSIIAARQANDKDKALKLLNEYVKNSFAISQLFHEINEEDRTEDNA